jgi:hypothetical protein
MATSFLIFLRSVRETDRQRSLLKALVGCKKSVVVGPHGVVAFPRWRHCLVGSCVPTLTLDCNGCGACNNFTHGNTCNDRNQRLQPINSTTGTVCNGCNVQRLQRQQLQRLQPTVATNSTTGTTRNGRNAATTETAPYNNGCCQRLQLHRRLGDAQSCAACLRRVIAHEAKFVPGPHR